METKSFSQDFSISISVFYNYTGWGTLILDCLIPFIDGNKEIKGYIFSLSRIRGEHIKIFLITSRSNALNVTNKADQHFRSFISANTIKSVTKDSLSKNDIFSNFKPNTVHYGVYDMFSADRTIVYNELDQEFSNLLKLIFVIHKNQTISSLTEIMIELFSSFIDYLGLKRSKVVEIFDKLIKNELIQYNPSVVQKILDINKKNFTNNKEEIILFLELEKKQSELYNESKKNWHFILGKFDVSQASLKVERETFLISKLCDIFDYKDRINAFFLFLNGFKLTKWSSKDG